MGGDLDSQVGFVAGEDDFGLGLGDLVHRRRVGEAVHQQLAEHIDIESAGVDRRFGFTLLNFLVEFDTTTESEMLAQRFPFGRASGGTLRLGMDRAGVDEVLDLVLAERATDLVIDKKGKLTHEGVVAEGFRAYKRVIAGCSEASR